MSGGEHKLVVGLLGGIGAGKSTVAQFLVERGAAEIDSDRLNSEELAQPEVVQTRVGGERRFSKIPAGLTGKRWRIGYSARSQNAASWKRFSIRGSVVGVPDCWPGISRIRIAYSSC